MIISLKDSDGKVVSTIVSTSNGEWMEIKCDYTFQKEKSFFKTEDSWLHYRNTYQRYTIVRGEREPYVSVKEKRRQNPISMDVKDTDLLHAIVQKYKRSVSSPIQKPTLLDSESTLKTVLSYHEKELRNLPHATTLYKSYLERRVVSLTKELKLKTQEIEEIGRENIQSEYAPLRKNTTVAYVREGDEYLPIGLLGLESMKDSKIIFKGKAAKTFSEHGLPDHPELWIWYKNTFLKAV